jgi:mannose-6-phosphate isomerase class I
MSVITNEYRKTSQNLIPVQKVTSGNSGYDIYPTHKLPEGSIQAGYASLAAEMLQHRCIILDGYQGVFFHRIKQELEHHFNNAGTNVLWIDIRQALKTPAETDDMIAPFLGGDDPLFGTRTTLQLSDFFDKKKLTNLRKTANQSINDITIIYGPGAALFGVDVMLVYIDIPKNEIQYRSRARSITNLGAEKHLDPKAMYKRFYFVEWIVLNRHKEKILPRVDIFADGQQTETITWAKGEHIRQGLHHISKNVFRVRPWFEPGVWGGSWCLQNIDGLNRDVPNYAWSFELIVPENGLIFESSGLLLEVSFDMLMYSEGANVMGDAFERFGTEFPIRFDFLDTFDGGNLSVQVHPSEEYTKKNFNENFTQEETYYILDAKEDAVVYLGFQEDINAENFEQSLRNSFERNEKLDMAGFVQTLPAKKHDLLLIPPGTIHASGKNTMVLEISSTPYIFTFKLYDWLRPDLDGKPRPLNISRGMENLDFERKGDYVEKNLVSRPKIIDQGPDWEVYHLPTHAKHFYDIHRLHLKTRMEVFTQNKAHVMSLVEGSSIIIETQSGQTMRFSYAETFVIPAAAGSYNIINEGKTEIKIVKAFVK